MRKWIINMLLLLACIIPLSCEFEFADDSFHEIKPVAPKASITLDNITDNMVLTEPITVTYSYNGNNVHRLLKKEFFLDDKKLASGTSSNGSFIIDPYKLGDGDYVIKVEFIFSSGTNSMADKSNLEGFVETNIYHFKIKNLPPETIVLSIPEIKEGRVHLTWDPARAKNLDKAILKIKCYDTLIEELELDRDDLLSGLYVDNRSVGNKISYMLRTTSKYKSLETNTAILEIEPFEIIREIVDSEHTKLIWSEYPLYANLDFFNFGSASDKNFQLNPRGGEIIIDRAPVFTDDHYRNRFYLSFYRFTNGVNNYELVRKYSRQIYFGKAFDKKERADFIYDSSNGQYICTEITNVNSQYKDVYIHQLNSDFSIAKTVSLGRCYGWVTNFIIDPISKNYITDIGNKSFLIDKNTLNIIESREARDYNSTGSHYRKQVYYRNDLLIMNDYDEDELIIYNTESKEELQSFNCNHYVCVSPSGKYLSKDGYFMKLVDGMYEQMYHDPIRIYEVLFIEDLDLCFYRNSYGDLYKYNLSTQEREQLSFTGGQLTYDPITKKVLVHNRSSITILDVMSMESRQVSVGYYFDSYFYFRYLNGRLINPDGYYFDKY